jgi:hypothetical protein
LPRGVLKVRYFVPNLPVKVRVSIPNATGFLLHLVALVFDAGLPAQRRLVNIEPRCTIAPTDFCRVKSQGVTASIPILSTIQSPQTARFRYDAE